MDTIKHLKKEKQDMTVKAKMGADRFKACLSEQDQSDPNQLNMLELDRRAGLD